MSTPLNGSLVKGFAILGLFSPDRSEITATTVTRELDMNAATAHRFLNTLLEVGALVSYRRGHYCLSDWIAELGRLADDSAYFSNLVRPFIDRASRELNESIMACRLGPNGPVCISVSPSERPISVNIKIGTTLPLHATAQGKLWLAHLSEEDRNQRLDELKLEELSGNTITDRSRLIEELSAIRTAGCAQNTGENEADIGAVSVPVFNAVGRMVLSLSAFGMLSRFDADLVARTKTALHSIAKDISAQI